MNRIIWWVWHYYNSIKHIFLWNSRFPHCFTQSPTKPSCERCHSKVKIINSYLRSNNEWWVGWLVGKGQIVSVNQWNDWTGLLFVNFCHQSPYHCFMRTPSNAQKTFVFDYSLDLSRSAEKGGRGGRFPRERPQKAMKVCPAML